MSLKKELVSGTIYMAIAKYSGMVMTILISAILSRLLTPENYGVVALAGVMLALFNLFADIGIGPAVIQNKTLTAEDMNSLNTFNSYQGLVLGVAFFLSAPYIAEYYGNPQVTLVCQVMSVNILMGCVNAVTYNHHIAVHSVRWRSNIHCHGVPWLWTYIISIANSHYVNTHYVYSPLHHESTFCLAHRLGTFEENLLFLCIPVFG